MDKFLVIIASILLRRGNRINFYYNTFYDQDKDSSLADLVIQF